MQAYWKSDPRVLPATIKGIIAQFHTQRVGYSIWGLIGNISTLGCYHSVVLGRKNAPPPAAPVPKAAVHAFKAFVKARVCFVCSFDVSFKCFVDLMRLSWRCRKVLMASAGYAADQWLPPSLLSCLPVHPNPHTNTWYPPQPSEELSANFRHLHLAVVCFVTARWFIDMFHTMSISIKPTLKLCGFSLNSLVSKLSGTQLSIHLHCIYYSAHMW